MNNLKNQKTSNPNNYT